MKCVKENPNLILWQSPTKNSSIFHVMKYSLKIFILFFTVDMACPVLANELMTPDELEKWFNDEINDDEARALAVNEGELEFLIKPPSKPAHHSSNILTIDKESLETGWVKLIQCHQNLDAVAASQVVYRYKRMRNLRVDSFQGIKRAWIEDNSVQMEDVESGAKLCVQADVGILYLKPDGIAILKNGPFHRKFLDGYYPMNVSLEIFYPVDLLRYESIKPIPQPGFHVMQTNSTLHVSAWFEGELKTEIRFSRISHN